MWSLLLWDGTQRGLVLVADISGQPISPIFMGQAVQEEFWSDQLVKMSRLSWNVSNYQSTLGDSSLLCSMYTNKD